MNRSETRAIAFEFLYSIEIAKVKKEYYAEQINLFMQAKEVNEKKVKTYIKELVNGINENEEEIIENIKENLSEKWDITRISKVDLVLLKMALYEMLYAKVEYKIVINEVVELAKKYGEESSPKFINGVLANIVKKFNLA